MRQSNQKERIITIALLVAVFFAFPAYAEESESAIDQVKKRLDSLIATKDEEVGGVIAIADRIGLLKEVVGISAKQARDLKARLVVLDYEENEVSWRDEMIKKLDEAVAFYSSIGKKIDEKEKEITLEEIILITNNLRQERNEKYLPLIEEINEFILISRVHEIIRVANRRLERIEKDLDRLSEMQFKGINELKNLFKEAKDLILEGEIVYTQARTSFWASYEEGRVNDEEMAAEAEEAEVPNEAEAEAAAEIQVETMTDEAGQEVEPQTVSIENLAGSSLNNIRGAYWIFIEMSNLVRKLL